MSSNNTLNPSSAGARAGENNFYLKNNDEIDLVELCSCIWAGKWKIVGAIFLCLVIAISYLSITPKIYLLETTLAPPIDTDLQSMQLQVLEKGYGSPERVFNLAKAYFQSEDELLKFWLLHNGKALLDSKEDEGSFLDFYSAISVREDSKTNTTTLLLQSTSPDKDVLLLNGLKAYINEQVINRLALRIQPNLKVQRERLVSEIARVKNQYQTTLQDQIARIQEALAIAEAVGIEKTPYDQLANIELKVVDNLYMLGSTTLSSQLKVLNERNGNDAFVPGLRDLQNRLEQIDVDFAFLNTQKDQARAFSVLQPVSRPLKPAKPKTVLVLGLSTILGVILGCFWLLIDAIVTAVKRRSKPLGS